MDSNASDLTLAVTMGTPWGIGPDITLESWLQRTVLDLPVFYVIADPDVLQARAAQLDVEVPIRLLDHPSQAAQIFPAALPVMPVSTEGGVAAGATSADHAPATIDAIRLGVEQVVDGDASALVTNPIHKKSLLDAGFDHPGHTEYLAALDQELTGARHHPVMMLAGPDLRTVPVTIHVPLRDVPALVTRELIVETGAIVARDLTSRFGISKPRLAIAGLNPHAGEGGALGTEDEAIVAPAVADLRKAGIDASGPMSADTMFHPEARSRYDVALCMYHDQALIPAKTLAFADSVNVTLGLSFIRTSPDHGTATDLAGTGDADPSSFTAALRMAASMSRRSQYQAGP